MVTEPGRPERIGRTEGAAGGRADRGRLGAAWVLRVRMARHSAMHGLALGLAGVLAVSAVAAQVGTGAPKAPLSREAGKVVAQVFGQTVTASDLQWVPGTPAQGAAQRLRALALREALDRYIAENRLQATPEDLAAYRDWDRRFRQAEAQRQQRELAELETQLARTDLPADTRAKVEAGREALLKLMRIGAEREAAVKAAEGGRKGPEQEAADRALRVWIEGHKARKSMYERYGGRVGLTRFGPDPVGASEALLREHEKAGRLRIDDRDLAQAFWEAFILEPRTPARPDQIDFTYYWLKPIPGPRR